MNSTPPYVLFNNTTLIVANCDSLIRTFVSLKRRLQLEFKCLYPRYAFVHVFCVDILAFAKKHVTDKFNGSSARQLVFHKLPDTMTKVISFDDLNKSTHFLLNRLHTLLKLVTHYTFYTSNNRIRDGLNL